MIRRSKPDIFVVVGSIVIAPMDWTDLRQKPGEIAFRHIGFPNGRHWRPRPIA